VKSCFQDGILANRIWRQVFTSLGIPGTWIIENKPFEDSRGSFQEVYKNSKLISNGISNFLVKQSNLSISRKNTIRGIHFSVSEAGQRKYVTCIKGAVMDLTVDLREDSKTFGKFQFVELNEETSSSIFIESGIGHGFIALRESSVLYYLVDQEFNPSFEKSLNPFDGDLDIDWKILRKDALLSQKDESAPTLNELIKNKILPIRSSN
jgi:dTDP-4-dehydrorhamnose 3,5-epimerase